MTSSSSRLLSLVAAAVVLVLSTQTGQAAHFDPTTASSRVLSIPASGCGSRTSGYFDTWTGTSWTGTSTSNAVGCNSQSPSRPDCINSSGTCGGADFTEDSSKGEMFKCPDPSNSVDTAIRVGNSFSISAVFKWSPNNSVRYVTIVAKGCGTVGTTNTLDTQFWVGAVNRAGWGTQYQMCFHAGSGTSAGTNGFPNLICGGTPLPSTSTPSVVTVTVAGQMLSIYFNGALQIGPVALTSANNYASAFPITLGALPTCGTQAACTSSTSGCNSISGLWFDRTQLYDVNMQNVAMPQSDVVSMVCYYNGLYGSAACPTNQCGNSVVEAGEACDRGANCLPDCTCPAGMYPSGGGCTPCPSGSKCPGGLAGATLCGNGEYQASTGQSSCSQCAPGSAFTGSGRTTPCPACSPGSYQTDGGRASCQPCAMGTASTDQGRTTECPSCTGGWYQDQTSQTTCLQCAKGTASNDIRRTTPCTGCTPGHYQDELGKTSCKDCDSGTAASDSSRTTACPSCLAGQFQPQSGQPSCSNCTEGSASSDTGRQSSCPACTSGHEQPYSGQSACTECLPGFSSLNGGIRCDPCGAGWYQPAGGSVTCVKCDAGTASSDQTRASACPECPVDTYQPLAGNSGCLACKDFSSTEGLTRQTSSAACKCLPGYFSDIGGACQPCQAGSRCAGQQSFVCNETSASYQNQAVQSSCKVCDANGTVSADRTTCTCNDGYYSPAEGLCAECPPGFRCRNGIKTSCSADNNGTILWYQDKPRATVCKVCSNGEPTADNSFCNCHPGFFEQTSTCRACLAGYQCANGTLVACLDGEYQNVTMQVSCKLCPANSTSTLPARTACMCQAGRDFDRYSGNCTTPLRNVESSSNTSAVVVPIVVVLVLLLVVVLIVAVIRRKRQQKKQVTSSFENNQEIGAVGNNINIGLNELHRSAYSSTDALYATATLPRKQKPVEEYAAPGSYSAPSDSYLAAGSIRKPKATPPSEYFAPEDASSSFYSAPSTDKGYSEPVSAEGDSAVYAVAPVSTSRTVVAPLGDVYAMPSRQPSQHGKHSAPSSVPSTIGPKGDVYAVSSTSATLSPKPDRKSVKSSEIGDAMYAETGIRPNPSAAVPTTTAPSGDTYAVSTMDNRPQANRLGKPTIPQLDRTSKPTFSADSNI
ncbi:hypothetical protein CAOG_05734 [Capsaspora owczarzaki ATCC 30864]|uniref:Tyrosine-protein kinase ephrin type A/B receptor-like domain-containing protein n=1 Tax=Capsaspora owczarzaki (strain ATCC 30864) TaxID=595528 RepID=A0A0D2X414_CAPO3|nr:hypothetical protein CAOG_05734 [Capsaspora owczarzaki ATCC 30864]KJE95264.1 hypothetical protein CAOG_005734 [Capsaspora owczarzaki ATCC 30864]|eukprot:XP_004346407.1 hypothetical protein CAOG_05734 [Capsaspora owczarzaki ATCC 30864]